MKIFARFTPRCALAISLALAAIPGYGQIATDGSVGPAQSLTGPNYGIGADLGSQRGANLFHSFQTFNIHTGESATFTGPSGLQNVISRVTGGSLSSIDGTLRSEITGANVWFINPAGVVFGANATLDVPAAFHVGTADELRFADGAVFSATNPAISTLSAEPVAAFGFLSAEPKRLEVNGSFLSVKEGQALSLVGGDITLTNATVYAPAGRLNVASVGSAGEVVLTETDVELRGFAGLGTLTMMHDPDVGRWGVDLGEPLGLVALADLDTSGAGGGAMFIRGENWLNQGGWVFTHTYGAQGGQGIDVAVTGDLTLLNSGHISTGTIAQGNAGAVTISARNLLVDGQGSDYVTGILSRAAYSTGSGGNLNLTVVENLSVLNGGEIRASTDDRGNAGAVTISAHNLLVDGQGSEELTGIFSEAGFGSTGAGGDVSLTIADALTVQNGGQIGTSTLGPGNAGAVTISAHNLLVDGQGSEEPTGIFSAAGFGSTGAGTGGDVNLTIADALTVQNGGWIGTNTFGDDSGDLTISAHNLLVDGQGSEKFTGISSITRSTGTGGNVNLTIADALTVQNGGWIGTNTFAQGHAGAVMISATNLLVDNGSSINSDILAAPEIGIDGGGNAGNITLDISDTLNVRSGGKISARSFALGSPSAIGNPGNIVISTGSLSVDSQSFEGRTGIFTDVQIWTTNFDPNGNNNIFMGGNISISVADSLSLLNGGAISTSTLVSKNSSYTGNAGNIDITAQNVLIDSNFSYGGIRATAELAGRAGAITITTDTLSLFNSGNIIAESAHFFNPDSGIHIIARQLVVSDSALLTRSYEGDAGSINLQIADQLILNNSSISTEAFNGDGGTITLNGGNLLLNNSKITTSVEGERGDGGAITLNPYTLVLDSGFIQANTTGANAKGGAIQINTQALLHPADQELRIGGPEREIPQPLEFVIPGVNVIQAAAPQGESGTLDVTTPDLNLSGALAGTSNRYSDLSAANQDPCARRRGQKPSTLTQVGRGGLPADNRPEGMTVSLSGGDWTPPEPAARSLSTDAPVALNTEPDDCRL